ncbi:MAG: hypothetical protein H6677_24550 [Candidatus Obscuribacterales bacterium]|nr:hypothetical protein [Cyanobacteria bacterium HKST-UBA01]MCB9471468.1 hypothetical protein [Candidatus Obscuribacterales bacterium]
MNKFASLLVLLTLVSGSTVLAEASKSIDKKASRDMATNCIPPFPALRPVDQADYEKNLPVEDREWIHKAIAHIEKNLSIDGENFKNISCSIGVGHTGDVTGPVIFSIKLSKAKQIVMTKSVLDLSPFPSLPSNHRSGTRQVIIGFGKASVTSIRFCK